MLPLLQSPPAIEAPAPTPSQEAESALLTAFDWGRPFPATPKLKGTEALDYRWLQAAATFAPGREMPANPYATGPSKQEAEALRRLLRTPKDQLPGALKALPLHRSGTALALWRWGWLQVRTGAFSVPVRKAWEDRLLGAGPALTRGYALRHALCWALADQDDARFTVLRAQATPGTEQVIAGAQRLYGLLGGPSTAFRLWTLPGLTYRDLRLDELGAKRIWICPAEDGDLPVLPADVAWLIPSPSGTVDERDAVLSDEPLTEAGLLADRLKAQGRSALFAPSRSAFERVGLAWFPILIQLDADGHIQSIRMGDAAPGKP